MRATKRSHTAALATAAANGSNRSAGFSLVELLIATSILFLLFGMVAQFMGLQTRASALQKATNEATESARIALSLLTWDIQNAGYRVTVTDSPADMLGINATEGGNADKMVIRYLDESLSTPSAQRISYSLGDAPRSLRRAQYDDSSTSAPAEQPTVATVVALNASYETRSNHFVTPDPSTGCPAGTQPIPDTGTPENCLVPWETLTTAKRLVRSVDLQLLSRSSGRVRGYQDPNASYSFADGSTYATEAGYVYHFAEQTVVSPNLGR